MEVRTSASVLAVAIPKTNSRLSRECTFLRYGQISFQPGLNNDGVSNIITRGSMLAQYTMVHETASLSHDDIRIRATGFGWLHGCKIST